MTTNLFHPFLPNDFYRLFGKLDRCTIICILTAYVFEYHAYGTSAQVEGGVPDMGILIDNRPRRARAGAARKRAAPSPWLSAGGKQSESWPRSRQVGDAIALDCA